MCLLTYLLGVQSAILAGKLEGRFFFFFFFYPFIPTTATYHVFQSHLWRHTGALVVFLNAKRTKGEKVLGYSYCTCTKGIEGGKRHGFPQREMSMESPPSPLCSTISGRTPFFPISVRVMWPPGINKRRTVHVHRSNCTMDTCIWKVKCRQFATDESHPILPWRYRCLWTRPHALPLS